MLLLAPFVGCIMTSAWRQTTGDINPRTCLHERGLHYKPCIYEGSVWPQELFWNWNVLRRSLTRTKIQRYSTTKKGNTLNNNFLVNLLELANWASSESSRPPQLWAWRVWTTWPEALRTSGTAGSQTCDLLIMSPTSHHYATPHFVTAIEDTWIQSFT